MQQNLGDDAVDRAAQDALRDDRLGLVDFQRGDLLIELGG
jgi:hypothetical protein